jgi:hypothetical protein
MLTKEILDSHPLKTLKSEIAKQNIKGYSTMKRPQLTDLMMKHKDKFMDLKHAEKKEKKAKAKAPPKPKATHQMPDGSEMTGKVHSKDSKPVKGKSKITIDLEKAKKSGVKLDLEKLKKAGVGIIEKKPKAPAKPKEIKEEPKPKPAAKPAPPKAKAKPKAKPKKAKDEPKTKGVNKKVKFFELAKGQGTSTKIGNVVGPDGNTYSPFIASRFWNARGFERAQFSKTDLKKIEKLAIKYGPIGEYSLGFNLDGFLKNKF